MTDKNVAIRYEASSGPTPIHFLADELIAIANDALRPPMGSKHPAAGYNRSIKLKSYVNTMDFVGPVSRIQT